MRGKVYLVGAGPGDPGLITVKGLRLLSQADVVVSDRLVSPRLHREMKAGAELINAGKPGMTQEEINAVLVTKAREGKTVVRLKGGDPFLLGRGGEEAEALAGAGIPFEVVPGVTSAIAVPAYAGIPVTHRDLSPSLGIVTGHEAWERSRIPWDRLATATDTLVVLMGLENLGQIVARLQENGRSPATPVALIRRGTEPQQETVVGTLGDILEKAAQAHIEPPVVMVVGEVVCLRERLRWFDCKPLFGKRILVTRSREQASRLSQFLLEEGAEPIEAPTIELRPLPDLSRLDQALARLSRYQWLIFTSANAVDIFWSRLQARGQDARALAGVKLAAIGPATAESLEARGLKPDLVPQEASSQGLLAAFQSQNLKRARVLLPRSQLADATLAQGLAERGALVEELPIYTVVPPPASPGLERLRQGEVDIVTFTSSSTVRHLAAILKEDWPLVARCTVACIGPATTRTARELGLEVQVEAAEHTIPGLVQALAEYFQRREP